MSSMKEKAKFPSDWCSYCQLLPDECANSGCPLNGLWVKFEDAEEACQKCNYREVIRIRKEEMRELKQKLKRLISDIDVSLRHIAERGKCDVTLTTNFINQVKKELEKMLDELLKEKKEAKTT